ncbi:serine/threonine-protein kinase [Streptomyces sp. NRRL S-87]|uniref:serine/threonine-protein kinase n=1 Tax=Streptomyces sp. NRRL S-87 TaxID=1463920 RepID=UPI0004C0FA33|nr:serine/threonine-protein kinase [Streptomyces sp. NRRL S-87]
MRKLRLTDPVEVGPYRLLAELGRGGMGRVLLGAGPDGRLAAVKQVHARYAADDDFRARFRREVAASRKVSGAFTAAVMDADPEAETPWLASVFVTGPSLGTVVDRVGALPGETVRRLAAGLAAALVEIHRAGLVHRDLKPDNVLLAEDGVRVIDFGIARAAEAGDGAPVTELTRSGVVVGSPAYMSPEQAEGRELTPASDVFSLGSVLVLAATGRSPFAAESTFQTLFDVVHKEPDLSGVPEGLRAAVAACLAKDPAGRPAPERLLELLGPVAPAGVGEGGGGGAGRWPASVQELVAAQQADVDLLLGAPERTVVDVSAGAPFAPVGHAGGERAGSTAVATAVDPASAAADDPVRRRILRLTWAGAALAIAGLVFGVVYAIWFEGADEKPEGDVYSALPACEELGGGLPISGHLPRDGAAWRPRSTSELCSWTEDGEATSHATVSWTVHTGTGTGTSTGADTGGGASAVPAPVVSGLAAGAQAAHASLVGTATKTESERVPVSGTDEAYLGGWDSGVGCRLGGRDSNLEVWVMLTGRQHPSETCRAEAERIIRGAIGGVPY